MSRMIGRARGLKVAAGLGVLIGGISAAPQPGFAANWQVQSVSRHGGEAQTPHVAVNARGVIVAVWERTDLAEVSTGSNSVQVAVRPPGHARWSAPRRLGAATPRRVVNSSALPEVTTLPDGRFLALWRTVARHKDTRLNASVADARGRRWSRPQRLTDTATSAHALLATGDGSLALAWVRKDPGHGGRVEVANLRRGASRFSAPATIATEPRTLQGALVRLVEDPHGALMVQWSDTGPQYTAVREAGATAWLPPEQLPASVDNAEVESAVTATQDGFVLAWVRDDDGRLAIARHPGGAGTWSVAANAGSGETYAPAVIGDGDRTIVSWCERTGERIAALEAGGLTAPSLPSHPSVCGATQLARFEGQIAAVFPDRAPGPGERRGGGAATGPTVETISGSPPGPLDVVHLRPPGAPVSVPLLTIDRAREPIIAWVNATKDRFQTSLDVAVRRSSTSWRRTRLARSGVGDIAGGFAGQFAAITWIRNGTVYAASERTSKG